MLPNLPFGFGPLRFPHGIRAWSAQFLHRRVCQRRLDRRIRLDHDDGNVDIRRLPRDDAPLALPALGANLLSRIVSDDVAVQIDIDHRRQLYTSCPGLCGGSRRRDSDGWLRPLRPKSRHNQRAH
jgi:hypothetical protein